MSAYAETSHASDGLEHKPVTGFTLELCGGRLSARIDGQRGHDHPGFGGGLAIRTSRRGAPECGADRVYRRKLKRLNAHLTVPM